MYNYTTYILMFGKKNKKWLQIGWIIVSVLVIAGMVLSALPINY
ncbi:MAG: hypothetical protein AAB587_01090 [Patescibacteria group bacterium]